MIPPTEVEIIAAMERAIEPYMEAVAYGQWMDERWAYAFQVQTDVQADNRTVPAAEELIAELPTMAWPD